MLKSLIVENYALIKRVEINFDSGFNVITGETGAGKSILVGALSLLLGQRADSDMVSDSAKKCIVEGLFNIQSITVNDFFQNHDLDFDTQIIIRREINTQGKSRAFINDTPVGLNILKELSLILFDIHSQHENLLITNNNFQLNLVDQYAQNKLIKDSYQEVYKNFKTLQNELDELIKAETKALSDRDYYEFLFNELSSSNISENEISIIEEELNTLQNIETIKQSLAKTELILRSSDYNVHQLLVEVKHSLSEIKDYFTNASELYERINSALIELDDVANDVDRIGNDLNNNPERLAFLTERLNFLNHLCVKHRVNDTNELIALMNEFDEKLQSISSLSDKIETCKKEVKFVNEKMKVVANELSKSRKNAIPKIISELSIIAKDLGMPDIQLNFKQDTSENYNIEGIDHIEIQFSANKGMPLRQLDKVASGGELSRIMLAVKSIISDKKLIPIVVFDEIDTGVSGDIAAKVASIMKKMSNSMQIIAITHLPQIAAKADAHYWVYKQKFDDVTVSNIKVLTQEERVNEIAKMISNDTISQASIVAAKELLSI